jgi:hypothetical protein
MKTYLILGLILISTATYAKRQGASQVGEKNELTSDDPCQAENIVGCGPCFKACMAQHQGDNTPKRDVNTRPRNGKAKASGQ